MKAKQISEVESVRVAAPGASGVRMQVLLGEVDGAPGFTMRLFSVDPHGHTPRHQHPYEHEIIAVSGSGELWTEDQSTTLEPGLVALVAPGELHQIRAGRQGVSFYCLVPNVGHVW